MQKGPQSAIAMSLSLPHVLGAQRVAPSGIDVGEEGEFCHQPRRFSPDFLAPINIIWRPRRARTRRKRGGEGGVSLVRERRTRRRRPCPSSFSLPLPRASTGTDEPGGGEVTRTRESVKDALQQELRELIYFSTSANSSRTLLEDLRRNERRGGRGEETQANFFGDPYNLWPPVITCLLTSCSARKPRPRWWHR